MKIVLRIMKMLRNSRKNPQHLIQMPHYSSNKNRSMWNKKRSIIQIVDDIDDKLPMTSPSLCPNPFAVTKKIKGHIQQDIPWFWKWGGEKDWNVPGFWILNHWERNSIFSADGSGEATLVHYNIAKLVHSNVETQTVHHQLLFVMVQMITVNFVIFFIA